MRKLLLCLLLFTSTMLLGLLTLPMLEVISNAYATYPNATNTMSKTVIDSRGSVNLLWVNRSPSAQNESSGLWYSRYGPNGTDSVAPILIRKSALIQSADMVVDKSGTPYIVWAEGTAFTNSSSIPSKGDSVLYSVELNLTNPESSKIVEVDGRDGIVMWPALVIDNSSKVHIVWSVLTPRGNIDVYYGLMDGYVIERNPLLLARYNQTVTLSNIQMIYDGASAVHIVWVESENVSSSHVVSTINCVNIDLSQKNVTSLQVANVDGALRDVTVTNGPDEGAYVLWQPQLSATDDVLYVSHVSRTGNVVFSKAISGPAESSSWYVAATVDSQENLYLVWYPEPTLPAHSSSGGSSSSNISFMKILDDGAIAESGNDVILGQVLAVNVGESGNLYAISTRGTVQVTVPSEGVSVELIGVTVMSSATLSGVAVTEEGRYRITRSLVKATKGIARWSFDQSKSTSAVLKAVARSPGVDYSELCALSKQCGGSPAEIVALESKGHIASVRVGLHRRFFQNTAGTNVRAASIGERSEDSIATRIFNAIAKNPDTWEGKLARDLGLSQQIVHYHLKGLVNRKMITASNRGRRKLYRVTRTENALRYSTVE